MNTFTIIVEALLGFIGVAFAIGAIFVEF